MRLNYSNRPVLLRSDAGLTVIEVLVAATITALIAAMLLGLAVATLAQWSRAQDRLMVENQARAVLDQMTQDIESARFRDDGNVWLAATLQAGKGANGAWVDGAKPVSASLDPMAASLADARFGVAGVWLRLFTSRLGADPVTNDPAGPVAVAYQIIRRSPTAGGGLCHYLLYRSEVSPAATLAAGFDLSTENYTAASDLEGAAGNIVSPRRRQVIADNVIDFGLRFYGEETQTGSAGSEHRQLFPLGSSALEYRATAPPNAADFAGRMPAVVEVMLRILTAEGARRIAALEAGKTEGDWWSIAQVHSRVFTRRIVIQAGRF